MSGLTGSSGAFVVVQNIVGAELTGPSMNPAVVSFAYGSLSASTGVLIGLDRIVTRCNPHMPNSKCSLEENVMWRLHATVCSMQFYRSVSHCCAGVWVVGAIQGALFGAAPGGLLGGSANGRAVGRACIPLAADAAETQTRQAEGTVVMHACMQQYVEPKLLTLVTQQSKILRCLAAQGQ